MPEKHVAVHFFIDSELAGEPDFRDKVREALASLAISPPDINVLVNDCSDNEEGEGFAAIEGLETKLRSSLVSEFRNYAESAGQTNDAILNRALTCFDSESINDVRTVLAFGSARARELRNFGQASSDATRDVLRSVGFTWHNNPSPGYIAELYEDPDDMPVFVIDDNLNGVGCSFADLTGKSPKQLESFLKERGAEYFNANRIADKVKIFNRAFDKKKQN